MSFQPLDERTSGKHRSNVISKNVCKDNTIVNKEMSAVNNEMIVSKQNSEHLSKFGSKEMKSVHKGKGCVSKDRSEDIREGDQEIETPVTENGMPVRENGALISESGMPIRENGTPVKPAYRIKHVSKLDIQDFTVQLSSHYRRAWQPQELKIEVELPGVTRASQVDANIWQQSVIVSTLSVPEYKLELPLPYPVNEETSLAKFDVSTEKLTLILTVIDAGDHDNCPTVDDHSPSSDSGIECDYRTTSDGDNSSEASVSSQEDTLPLQEGATEIKDCDFEPEHVDTVPASIRQNEKSLKTPTREGAEEEDDCVFETDPENISLPKDPLPQREAESTEEEGGNVFDAELEATLPPPDDAALVPSYSIKQNKKSLIVSIHCGNVLPSSVQITQPSDQMAIIVLSSMGSGQTLLKYRLDILTSPNQIAQQGVSYLVEERQILVTVKKVLASPWDSVRVGHDGCLATVDLTTEECLEGEEELEEPVTKPENEDKEKDNGGEEEEEEDDEEKTGEEEKKTENEVEGTKDETRPRKLDLPRPTRMNRTVSMCESGTNFRLKGPTCSWPRGILKHRARSLSESHVGADLSALAGCSTSSSTNLEEKLEGEEEEAEESTEEVMSSSLGEKKSVRFNEVVSRQLFRSNSSILAQRAKNQKKALKRRKNYRAKRSSSAEMRDEAETRDGDETSGSFDGLTTSTDEDTDATTNEDEHELGGHTIAPQAKESHPNRNPRPDPQSDCGKIRSHSEGIENNNSIKAKEKECIGDKSECVGDKSECGEGEIECTNSKIEFASSESDRECIQDKSEYVEGKIECADGKIECVPSESDRGIEEDLDDSGFIVKTSKKKRKNNKKNKIKFEPSNSLIFQLDMDK